MSTYSEDDKKAVYHILQLAEQGRPIETIAQMLASMWAAGGETLYFIMNDIGKIVTRVEHLMAHDSEMWPGLMPGGWRDEDLYQPDDPATIRAERDQIAEDNTRLQDENKLMREILNDVQVALNRDLAHRIGLLPS